MNGKTCVVTGANSGIGRVLALELGKRGARVVMVARNEASAKPVLEEVRAVSAAEPSLEIADLSSMAEVRSLAERLCEIGSIDVLMNNAGIYLPKRRVTAEGHEESFAVNHLAPFLLTNLLREGLRGGRVVTTTSAAYASAAFDLEDLMMEKRKWKPLTQYANAKLGTVLFTREGARRFADDEIKLTAFHPGGVRSGMAQDEPSFIGSAFKAMSFMLRSPEKGAETGLYLATDDAARDLTGEYLIDCKVKRLKPIALDDDLASRLWSVSETLTGIA